MSRVKLNRVKLSLSSPFGGFTKCADYSPNFVFRYGSIRLVKVLISCYV